ncbi:hypothetical protein D3C78_1158300 [compost metagenome]
MILQLADIDLTDQRGNILVVLIARFGFGDGNLFQNRRAYFDDFEFGDVAAKLMQALGRPRRHDGAEVAIRDVIFFLQNIGILLRVEQAQRVVVNRAAFPVGAQGVDRHQLHQCFQAFCQ